MLRYLFTALSLVACLGITSLAGAAYDPPRLVGTPEETPRCSVPPRSSTELRSLALAGLTKGSEEEALPATNGRPASTAIIASVERTAQQAVACATAGNLPALAALSTDEAAARMLAGLAIFLAERLGIETPTSQDLDPAFLDMFVSAIKTPTEVAIENQRILVAVRDVQVLPDGRVTAMIVTASAHDASDIAEDRTVLRKQGNRYLIDIDGSDSPPASEEALATPVASPPAS